MKTKYIIAIAVVVTVVIIGLAIGLGMRGYVSGGNIGVIEIENIIYSSKTVVKDLKNFGDDPSIRAIVIRVDSPGGVVAAAQEIYEEIARIKGAKRIVVSMGTVAASGGYYVSLPADVIVANPGTITGSIGVIMEWPVIEKLLGKLGIEFEVIKSKKHKDIGAPYRRLTDEEKELLGEVISDTYDQFVNATAENRDLPRDSVLKFADGRILNGQQAKEVGLIDTLGSFETAVKIAGDLVGIEKPNLVYAPKRLSLIQLIINPMESLLIPKLLFLWH